MPPVDDKRGGFGHACPECARRPGGQPGQGLSGRQGVAKRHVANDAIVRIDQQTGECAQPCRDEGVEKRRLLLRQIVGRIAEGDRDRRLQRGQDAGEKFILHRLGRLIEQ